MDKDNPAPDPQAPDSEEAPDSPASQEASPEERPEPSRASPPPEKGSPEDKAQKRELHLRRALLAAGKAKPEDKDEPAKADGDGEPDADKDEQDDADKDETAEQKSERLAKLDKLKSHKHLAKAKERLAGEITELEKREKAHAEQQAKDDRINAQVTREFGPFAEARAAYQRKDYRGTAQMLKGLLGDEFPQIARNIWNATKDGMATADLRHEVESLKAQLADKGKQETEQQQTAKAADEGKQLRTSFEKRVKGHALLESGDEELVAEAFAKWRQSWDPDLEEYSLSAKKAADAVLDKHTRRAERLTGKRRATPAARETRDGGSQKPLRDMSKEEKRKYHLERATRQKQADQRARERHA